MLRAPESIWVPKRVANLLKVKKFLDDDATVVGYQAGLGKFQGMLGALVVTWREPKSGAIKRFNLSGFTDNERMLLTQYKDWASGNPGSEYTGSQSISVHFKYGDKVRFRYRTITDDGYPREARFWR